MGFSWPASAAVPVRLWRLRRLIAFSVALPAVFFGIMGVFGFGAASSTTGFIAVLIALSVIMAAHAVIFPNALEETLAIALVMSALAILGPVIGTLIFGWFLFILFAVSGLWFGQQHILNWQSATPLHQPTLKSKVKSRAPLKKVRTWFPLRPNSTRGQYRCGEPNAEKVFPVWYDMPSVDVFEAFDIERREGEGTEDQDIPPSFYALIEVDEPAQQTTHILSGAQRTSDLQAVVEHHFQPKENYCIVTEIEVPSGFPKGQSFMMWLNDYAQDGLSYHRDLLDEIPTHALRVSHRYSILMVFSQWFLKRMMGRNPAGLSAASQSGEPVEISEEKLTALLGRLGPDYMSKGYSDGPLPLVTLEEFFDGNGDDGSFQGASIPVAKQALEALRTRKDVADVRLGVTQWEGPKTWPLAEHICVVTTAGAREVGKWLKEAGVWVTDIDVGNEHLAREPVPVPDGHRIVWAWVD